MRPNGVLRDMSIDRERSDRLHRTIENFTDCDTAYVDARNEAIDTVGRWADGDPHAREDWLAAIRRMTQARSVRDAARRALELARDEAMQ